MLPHHSLPTRHKKMLYFLLLKKNIFRNIKAGQEVSECYGQMYYNKSADLRQVKYVDVVAQWLGMW
jgi:hypothetical protein